MLFRSSDEEFEIGEPVASGGHNVFANAGDADNEEGDSDVQTFVTRFGTKVVYDNDKGRSVKIMVPEEQVKANVEVVFGGTAAETMTKIVDADQADSVKKELEDDGYEIISEDKEKAEKVEFDVEAVTLDTDVTEVSDMIVVGGPAVNAVARELLGVEAYTVDQAGVEAGKGLVKYFEDKNTVLVYGYSKEDTTSAVTELNNGGLSGTEKSVE